MFVNHNHNPSAEAISEKPRNVGSGNKEPDTKRILDGSVEYLPLLSEEESTSKSSSPKLKSSKSVENLSLLSDEYDVKSLTPKRKSNESVENPSVALHLQKPQVPDSNESDTAESDSDDSDSDESDSDESDYDESDSDESDSELQSNESSAVSYGNLPGYMVSLLEKLPKCRPRRSRAGRDREFTLSPTEKLLIDKAMEPKVMPDLFVYDYIPETTPEVTAEDIIDTKRRVAEAIERKEDFDDIVFSFSPADEELAGEFATAALLYLREKGESLELVKASLFELGPMAVGARVHFNFKAKRTDNPSAPVETYFAQLRFYGPYCRGPNMILECCVSLGASDLLPCERDNRGCRYCTKFVHHPVDGCDGMIWGYIRWSEEHGDDVVI